MFENVKAAYFHIASGCASVFIKHMQKSLPEQFHIFFRKPGYFIRKCRGDMPAHAVQGIRNNIFRSHLCIALGRARLIRLCLTGNRHIVDSDWRDTVRKTELDRSADNTAGILSG